eukprot:4043135-Pleurochrysis_carterae.AAC.1
MARKRSLATARKRSLATARKRSRGRCAPAALRIAFWTDGASRTLRVPTRDDDLRGRDDDRRTRDDDRRTRDSDRRTRDDDLQVLDKHQARTRAPRMHHARSSRTRAYPMFVPSGRTTGSAVLGRLRHAPLARCAPRVVARHALALARTGPSPPESYRVRARARVHGHVRARAHARRCVRCPQRARRLRRCGLLQHRFLRPRANVTPVAASAAGKKQNFTAAAADASTALAAVQTPCEHRLHSGQRLSVRPSNKACCFIDRDPVSFDHARSFVDRNRSLRIRPRGVTNLACGGGLC